MFHASSSLSATQARPASPPWAVIPSTSIINDNTDDWCVCEIKDGIVMARYSLRHRTMTVWGRAEDVVDIPCAHASVSRCHARIACDAHGTWWLRDYDTPHGTFVNKVRLPSKACGKTESTSGASGARGVRVFPGDMIRLGASTRYFLLEGPDQYRREHVKALPSTQPKSTASTIPHSTNHSAAPTETHSNSGFNNPIRNDTQDEDDNINRRALPFELEGYDNNDDEDVEDRTRHDTPHTTSEAATEASLLQQWHQLRDNESTTRTEWQAAQAQLTRAQTAYQQSIHERDNESSFFLQNDCDLARERISKLQEQLDDLQDNIKETERLLRIVNPRWNMNATDEGGALLQHTTTTDTNHYAPTPKVSSTTTANDHGDEHDTLFIPTPTVEPTVNSNEHFLETTSSHVATVDTAVLPLPPSSSLVPSPSDTQSTAQSKQDNDFVMPAPKRSRIVGPSKPLHEAASSEAIQKRGTLSILSSLASTTTTSSHSDPMASLATHTKEATASMQQGTPMIQAQSWLISDNDSNKNQDTWTAPKDQDGSGITKLNAKFAGRY
jgi:pSer/pThr/pTyr-binding forkhead associated (FHA) protein